MHRRVDSHLGVGKVCWWGESQTPRSLWTKIWSLSVPPKIRTFLWSICQNAIPTRENLHKKKISPDPLCQMCHTEIETTEHVFLLCRWTKEIWRDNRIQSMTQMKQIRRIDQWMMTEFTSRRTSPEREFIAWVLWQIWKARNARIFRDKLPNSAEVIDQRNGNHPEMES